MDTPNSLNYFLSESLSNFSCGIIHMIYGTPISFYFEFEYVPGVIAEVQSIQMRSGSVPESHERF